MFSVTKEGQNLHRIKGMTDVLEDIAWATIEVSSLVDAYLKHGFFGELFLWLATMQPMVVDEFYQFAQQKEQYFLT
jgi:hypothetical protein